MTTDHRGLGFDPVPGNADAVRAAAGRCARAAIRLPAPDASASAGKALRTTAAILDEWAGTLLANRRRAEQLDQCALRLRRALLAAADEVDSATATAQFSTAPGVEAERRAAMARHEQLTRELERVLESARLLEREHLAESDRVTVRLRTLDGEDTEVAARKSGHAELFAGLGGELAGQAAFAAELAAAVLCPPPGRAEPEFAAGAFAAALAR
ncbi:hypothetical protein [Amycolatopsis sp. YIM 10]|uniref:hypothetical protein n=1 Tax=Amycolatopsis sp. YIM 10 TaxID=2653857 RepID=UPI0012900896|nr:hypothetical protein [Amycolatopsis sp. YIM 10]QFU92433.1 hypothetical protein YIM_36370 [Amycolatopsis sp. YIM 10]